MFANIVKFNYITTEKKNLFLFNLLNNRKMDIKERIEKRAESLACGGKKKKMPMHDVGKKIIELGKKKSMAKKSC